MADQEIQASEINEATDASTSAPSTKNIWWKDPSLVRLIVALIAIVPPITVAVLSTINGYWKAKLEREKHDFAVRSSYIKMAVEESLSLPSRLMILRFIRESEIGSLREWADKELVIIRQSKKNRIEELEEYIGLHCTGNPISSAIESTSQEIVDSKNYADRLLSLGRKIRFEYNSQIIAPESRKVLKEIARILLANKESKVTIEAHAAEPDSSNNYNTFITEKRAKEVCHALIGFGIDESRLRCRGLGATSPIADNSTEDGRLKNRRIDIFVKNNANK